MSAMLDPYTLFRIGQLGLAEGWHCLELGAGNGSMSQELCKRVGPAGHVVAIDLDTAFVSEISAANLEVRTQNVVEADFEEVAVGNDGEAEAQSGTTREPISPPIATPPSELADLL